MEFFRPIKRQTPESVELEFLLAGIGGRTYALMVDYLILSLALVSLFFVSSFLAAYVMALISAALGTTKIELWLFAIAALTGFIIYVGYFVLFETFQNGQTPGKKLASIQVVREDGRPVAFPQSVMRALLRPVDDLLWIGFFMIILGKQEKRLGDWLAGTLVVQTQTKSSQKRSPKVEIDQAAYPLAASLRRSPNIALLQPDDMAVLREYLRRRSAMSPAASQQLSLKLANEICSILEFDQPPAKVPPEVFLESVYLAYHDESEPPPF